MALRIRERVAVACVTFETVMVTKPIIAMGSVDRVYLVHYEREDPGKTRRVYTEFYDEVVHQLEVDMECGEIIPVNVEVYDFQKVLGELLSVLTMEIDDGNDVYINVSAGTTEYSAASILASMMVKGVRPFTVSTKEWTIPIEEIDVYYEDGRPVGLSKDVYPPRPLPYFHIERPPEELVRGLKILKERKEKGHVTTYLAMIGAMKDAGCWDREDAGVVKDQDQAEKMFYARHYIEGWARRGWVTKDRRGRLDLTEDGVTVTQVF
ncbi:MAG: hypothetical protein JSW25_01730 [Thermoplasmata archaeon]|nr:MAG: hypothetical protein JSW25_01730 [Thermoplasmata archaeon]